MDGIILRRARREDIPEVCRIWSASFGDSPELVERLMNGCGLSDSLTVAEECGRVCSAMAAFDGLRLGGLSASYIYALCTDPVCRGRGIGSALVKKCALLAFERGSEAAFLHPASLSLAAWYSGMGFHSSPPASVRPPAGSDGTGAVPCSGEAVKAGVLPISAGNAQAGVTPISGDNAIAGEPPVSGDDTMAGEPPVSGDNTMAGVTPVSCNDTRSEAFSTSNSAAVAEAPSVSGDDAGSEVSAVFWDNAQAADGISVTPCTAGEYLRLRGPSPVEVSLQLMAVQELFCSLSGGALLLLSGRDFQGAACCEPTDAGLLVRELICPARLRELCISALKRYFGAKASPLLLLSSPDGVPGSDSPTDSVPNIMYMLRTGAEFEGGVPLFPFILD